MITNEGRLHIKRFHAGYVPRMAGSIVLGTGTTAAALGDKSLVSEIVRLPVLSSNVDTAGNRWVFTASLPANSINTVYEVGLYSEVSTTPVAKAVPLSQFSWTNGTFSATNARAAIQAVKIDYVASGTTNAEISDFFEDYSSFVATDRLAVAFHATANISSVRVRLGTDSSNYYEFVIASPTTGYNVHKLAFSSATKTGTPSWDNLTYLAVRPSATAGGAGSLYLDSIRAEYNTLDPVNILVARAVLGTPQVIDNTMDTDVEYSFGVSFT